MGRTDSDQGGGQPVGAESIETGTEKLLLDFPAEAVARLTISSPAKRNALDHDMLDAISSTLPRLDRGIEIRCLVITGADPVFSAGYDIGSIPDESFERDAEALVAHPFTDALKALDAFPWPTVAAVNGLCLGGGLELAITCDLRICASGAQLGMPPAKLGLVYGHTGLARFIETIGAPRTRELFFTGNNIGASRAEAINLVNRVVPDGEIGAKSVEFASCIAANAPLSMKGNKRAIATILANPTLSPEQEAELLESREACFSSADFLEGITAFGEKRKPRWTGR